MCEEVEYGLLKGAAFGTIMGFDVEFFDNVYDIVFVEKGYLSDMIMILLDTVITTTRLLTLTMLKQAKLTNRFSMFAFVHFGCKYFQFEVEIQLLNIV